MELTILIPARNEEESLPITLENIEKNVKVEHELLVVNDHSQDRTVEVVSDFQKKYPHIRCVSNDLDAGFTNALKKGFQEAKGKYIVVVMADSCDDPKTINLMYKKIKEGYDVVCGSRYIKGGGKKGGRFWQNFFSKFVCLSLYYLGKIPVHDASNAFKMYRKEAINSIEIEEAGFASSLEIIVKLHKKGYRITEVPTFWKGRVKGKSHFRLIRVARNYIRWYMWALFHPKG
jgi:glycosyltransferase involved in cell wall biosynthesis